MIEKREGHGEDSAPLSIVKDDFCAVGVFDGMGGSGAAICKSEFGDNHTKAYVASRIILEAIYNYFENVNDVRSINSDGIKFTARGRLEQEKCNYPTKASGLRSKLVRDYPTTLAITTSLKNEDGSHVINSYWAGDSRNYLWTQEGFFQISKDDLDSDLDPLENLRNDGALSNCICVDREFCINNKTIQVPGKFVILSATDGCFNYFATPMHFQEVLLSGLKCSENVDEWETFCKTEFSAVTGDDVSISLLAIGFSSFTDLKETFMQSIVAGINEMKSVQDEIKQLTSQLGQAQESLEALIQHEWDIYKLSYMKYFSEETEPTLEEVNSVVSEEASTESLTEDNAVIPVKDEASCVVTAEVEKKIDRSEHEMFANMSEEAISEVKGVDNSNTLEEDVCEFKKESQETEKPEKDVLFSDKEETEKYISEVDVAYDDHNVGDEKSKTAIPIDVKKGNETPKFGRMEQKLSLSNNLRSKNFNQSKNDDDRIINQFMNNPSYETAHALIDLILDLGESIISRIPQKIRIELKKFIR